MFNAIIIGGMAAGCKAAVRLSRLSSFFNITVIEKGSFISFSSCGLPLYAAGEIDDLSDLYKTSYGAVRDVKYFREVKGVRVLVNTEVLKIDTNRNEVDCININSHDKFNLPYDYLIIATGAESVKPSFPYPSSPLISSFHSPSDSKYFRNAVQKGEIKKATIIGGGFIGCEMIEALSALWGIETTLIEKEKHLLTTVLDPEISSYVENSIKSDKVSLILNSAVTKIELDENGSPVVYLEDRRKIFSDYVFYCLGVKPNTGLAQRAKIKVGEHGGIIVNDEMETNIANIWAAGDCVEIKNLVTDKPDYFSFGSLSNRMGRSAADSIACLTSRGCKAYFKGAVGTLSLKVFDNIICAAGLSENKAQSLGFNTGSVIGSWYDRPDYHPDAKDIIGKLVYERPGMKLLGLQLVGEGEVTRYIDVFSELLAGNKRVEDMLNIEHGYTPAHSSPISPLNYLGYMAISQEKAGIKNFNPLHISSFNGVFIDVREPSERESTPFVERAIQIPLSELRIILNSLNLEEPILFVCERGTRSYEAARIFANHGYKNVAYLGGGNLVCGKLKMYYQDMMTSHEY